MGQKTKEVSKEVLKKIKQRKNVCCKSNISTVPKPAKLTY